MGCPGKGGLLLILLSKGVCIVSAGTLCLKKNLYNLYKNSNQTLKPKLIHGRGGEGRGGHGEGGHGEGKGEGRAEGGFTGVRMAQRGGSLASGCHAGSGCVMVMFTVSVDFKK